MGFDTFEIDDTSALGRRVQALLSAAGVVRPPRIGPGGPRAPLGERATRLLLVDGEPLARGGHLRASRVVHVEQSAPLAGDRATKSLGLARPTLGRVMLVRTALYFESLLPRLALGLSSGHFLSATPEHKAAYVAHEDAAIVAAAVLASDLGESEALHVSGPATFSHRELCALAGELFSRPVQVEQVAAEQLSRELLRRGMSAEQATLSAHADRVLRGMHDAVPSLDGPRITGMAALSLPSFLERSRESLMAATRSKRAHGACLTHPASAASTLSP